MVQSSSLWKLYGQHKIKDPKIVISMILRHKQYCVIYSTCIWFIIWYIKKYPPTEKLLCLPSGTVRSSVPVLIFSWPWKSINACIKVLAIMIAYSLHEFEFIGIAFLSYHKRTLKSHPSCNTGYVTIVTIFVTALSVNFLYPFNLVLRSQNIDIESIDKHSTNHHVPVTRELTNMTNPLAWVIVNV